MSIRWITEQLGTAPASSIGANYDVNVIDVRDLVDKDGNSVDLVHKKIMQGVASLQEGYRTVICCDYGMSRSNAIATGVLSKYEDISLSSALRRVLDSTGEKEIKLQPLSAVREALSEYNLKKSNLEKKIILVTGANGFLGRSFIDSKNAYNLLTPSRKEIDLLLGETELALYASDNNIDYIVHLANPRIFSTNRAIGESVIMLRNVIEVCLINDITLVFPSCSEVYAGKTEKFLASEETPLFPFGHLGEAKYLAEKLINYHREKNRLKCVILRSSTVYGATSGKPKFIYNFISKANKAEKISSHSYKNGLPCLDLLYIDDWMSALLKVIDIELIEDINIGTGDLISTREIAKIIIEITNSNSQLETILIESNIGSIAMDSSKATELLGWGPKTFIREGIKKLIYDSVNR